MEILIEWAMDFASEIQVMWFFYSFFLAVNH